MKKKRLVNKGFLLYKKESNTFSLYKVICKKIPTSIFTKLGYNFFESLVENNIINVFYIKKQNKLASIITVVNHENYNILKKQLLKFVQKEKSGTDFSDMLVWLFMLHYHN